MTDTEITQVPGLYHRRIGDVLVTAIADGYVDAPFAALQSIEPNEAEGILTANFRVSPPRITVNCYLIRAGGRIAVVDTGSGDTMGPTLGHLPALLTKIGVDRSEIDTILLTHMHPDHSNGLTSPSGERFFPNAEIVVAEEDVKHWHDDGAMSRVNDSQQERYFMGARFQAAPYMDRLKPAVGDVFPHVTAMPLHGHTPGHTGYLVESAGESLLIWGDICHVPDIQVRRPEVTMVFDTDPAAAIETRRKTFDMTSADGVLIAGMHLHFPGFSHLVKEAGGYSLIPESWSFTT